MKLERLIGILSILLQRERVTAPELAERFEVSRRTIQRDVEALCRAGIPLVTVQGAGGGISILEGYRVDRTVLTGPEMQDILAGLRSLDSVSGTCRYAQLMEKLSAGGQMALTQQIDNYPGFEDSVDGFTLAEKMQAQAERFGARTKYAQVERLDLTASPKVLETSEGTFLGKTVVLATGADPRKLGVDHEEALVGRGVAYCAACDGMFYRGKTVVVVGGGNSAAADALLLSRIAKKVILVHRRDALRATKIYHEPLKQAENLEFRWNSAITGLLYGDRLTGVQLKNLNSGEVFNLDCDGLFISVGRTPATELVRGQLELDPGGYILAGETTETSIPGVFAVGDVRTKRLRQVVTAVSDGAVAVHMAEEYLAGGT